MPQIPLYTPAQRGVGVGSTPIPQAPRNYAAEGLAENVAAGFRQYGEIERDLQRQEDERMVDQRFGAWTIGTDALKRKMFFADPNDPESVPPPLQDVEKIYLEESKKLREQLSEGLSPTGKRLFDKHIYSTFPTKLNGLQQDVIAKATDQNRASLYTDSKSLARASAATSNPDEAATIEQTFTGRVMRAESRGFLKADERAKLLENFKQTALYERASILIKDASTREQFYEKYAKGEFNDLDPLKLATIRKQAEDLDARASKVDAANERAIKAAQEDRKISVWTRGIMNNDVEGAKEELKFYMDNRLVSQEDGNRIWDDLMKPKQDGPSNPDTLEMISRDVTSIRPRFTAEQIFARTDLNLKDKTRLANEASEKQKGWMLHYEGEAKSALRFQHAQAEENLRLMLGITPGMLTVMTKDDPNGRLLSYYMDQLSKRSSAMERGGKENPLDVVESFRKPITEALGKSAMMKPGEVKALYPTWESLGAAVNSGRVNQEQLDEQLKIRPPAPQSIKDIYQGPPQRQGPVREQIPTKEPLPYEPPKEPGVGAKIREGVEKAREGAFTIPNLGNAIRNYFLPKTEPLKEEGESQGRERYR